MRSLYKKEYKKAKYDHHVFLIGILILLVMIFLSL